MLSWLDELRHDGQITDLDVHFARFICRLANDDSPELVLGAALVSHHTADGHVCVNLPALGQTAFGQGAAAGVTLPSAERWVKVLRRSAVVGYPDQYRPLILDEHGRLYLYRYWDYERRLASDLLLRARAEPGGVDETLLASGLERLFVPPHDDPTDWQRIAAAVAVLKRLSVISGGPGTGKTTTVTRILALLLEQAGSRRLHIALAAPTGKAAARMQAAVADARRRLDVPAALREAIPEQASTLHRLLGVRPGSIHFRHDRDHPLPCDVLVIDEASMVDLSLMTKLLEALPHDARLILIGDRDQLASVEAGAVLGDICAGKRGFTPAFTERLRRVAGGAQMPAAREGSPLGDAVVLLDKSYRFTPDSGIGRLARLINRGEGDAALEVMAGAAWPDVTWRACASPGALREQIAASVIAGYHGFLEQILTGADLPEVFEAFDRFRLLCARRNGTHGVEGLNWLSEEILHEQHLIEARRNGWYSGRPVMVTRNDYTLRLFNGDVGIAMPDPAAGGRLRVFFQTPEGGVRSLHPARMPDHQTAYAMTVHKSQGSEFDRVALVLPPAVDRVVTRELLYTGITRARQAVEIWATEAALLTGAAARLTRTSGLRERLWNPEVKSGPVFP
jgi:exodeoxyribonuclease V alpha subunit